MASGTFFTHGVLLFFLLWILLKWNKADCLVLGNFCLKSIMRWGFCDPFFVVLRSKEISFQHCKVRSDIFLELLFILHICLEDLHLFRPYWIMFHNMFKFQRILTKPKWQTLNCHSFLNVCATSLTILYI